YTTLFRSDPVFDPHKITLLELNAPSTNHLPIPEALGHGDANHTGESAQGHSLPTRYNWQPERIEMETDCPEPALAVVAEPIYPGWHATIDGNPTRIFRANGVCRAVYVPAGKHRVVFTYRPWSL